jgi:anti-anti-sigma regulatory factor
MGGTMAASSHANDPFHINDPQSLIQFYQQILDAVPLLFSTLRVEAGQQFRTVLLNQELQKARFIYPSATVNTALDQIMDVDNAMTYEVLCESTLSSGMVEVHQISMFLDGKNYFFEVTCSPFAYQSDTANHVAIIWHDITERYDNERQIIEAEQAIMYQQAQLLNELSSPLLQISKKVLLMPLIGIIDDQRMQLIVEHVLQATISKQASTIIIDITGITVVDAQVATSLVSIAQAVQLLGAKVLLTGVRAEVAQTLVGLGIDLSKLVTLATLREGIQRSFVARGRV